MDPLGGIELFDDRQDLLDGLEPEFADEESDIVVIRRVVLGSCGEALHGEDVTRSWENDAQVGEALEPAHRGRARSPGVGQEPFHPVIQPASGSV